METEVTPTQAVIRVIITVLCSNYVQMIVIGISFAQLKPGTAGFTVRRVGEHLECEIAGMQLGKEASSLLSILFQQEALRTKSSRTETHKIPTEIGTSRDRKT